MNALFSILFSFALLAPALAGQDRTESGAKAGTESTTTQIPPATKQDEKTEGALRAVFSQVEQFSGIEVRARAGVIRLSGKAPTPEIRAEAVQIAKSAAGVIYVDDLIDIPRVASDAHSTTAGAEKQDTKARDVPTVEDQRIQDKLQGVYSRVPELSSLTVAVAAGVVRLEGEVSSKSAKEQALKLAQETKGVVFVDDAIHESTQLADRLAPTVDRMFEFVRDFIAQLPLFALAMLVFFGGWWIARRAGESERLAAAFGDNALMRGVLRHVMKSAIFLGGLFVALDILDATALVGAVLGTAGVFGLAIGFAFRDIVENYLASILLSIRQPFRTKDFVEVGNHKGTVIRMTTRSTVLMTPDGNHLIVPNADVFKSAILNYSQNPMRRFDVGIGVGTDVDLEAAQKIGLELLRAMKGVVEDPKPVARVESLGDSNVQLRFYGWVDQRDADFGKVKSETVRLLKSIMEENDVDLPIPTYKIQIERDREAPEVDAAALKRRSLRAARAEAKAVDVQPDNEIEKQVEDELRISGEEDLLVDEPSIAGGVATAKPERQSS